MDDAVASFYNQLAPWYHLIFKDWDESIERQGEYLSGVLETELGAGSLKILDCACGIGTQSIGLALRGHRVTASDLSAAAVERARHEMDSRGLDVRCVVSDMCSLAEIQDRDFDVVISMDNALPHLPPAKVPEAAHAMHSRLRAGGLLVAGIRDYDAMIRERPTVQGPTFYGTEGRRRIAHQVWDWVNEDHYMIHLYITEQHGDRWESHHFVSTYRAMQRDELSEALVSAGFENVRWIMPNESGHYTPVVRARKRS